MIKIHSLYRDFFLFLRAMNSEKEKWNAFRKYPLDRNRIFCPMYGSVILY
jgi:pyoverdine/dityrosine biosynthesis protein Dit1